MELGKFLRYMRLLRHSPAKPCGADIAGTDQGAGTSPSSETYQRERIAGEVAKGSVSRYGPRGWYRER